jgi:hypothetical protein
MARPPARYRPPRHGLDAGSPPNPLPPVLQRGFGVENAGRCRDLGLTADEACLVCDALSGTWLENESLWQVLRAEIADAIEFNHLDEKWDLSGDQAQALVRRLHGMSDSAKRAVVLGVQGFWA